MQGGATLDPQNEPQMILLESKRSYRQRSDKSLKMKISPAQITNFKSLSKLKIKPKRKNSQVGSMNKRRKINLQNKFSGNGFLDRVQNLSSQKKLALNLKIKEKLKGVSVLKDNSNAIQGFHAKNKSEIPTLGETTQFTNIYNTTAKFKGFAKAKNFGLPHAFNIKERGRKPDQIKASLNNPLQGSKGLEIDLGNNEFKRRSSSLGLFNGLNTSKSSLLSLNPSLPSINTKIGKDAPFYIPASTYKQNAKLINKKSRSENRK